jgi:AbrB family looped-hinge helix DNA binding protein
MSTIQMHYDGWLTLPAAVRQRLGLGAGDRLELELAGDTVVLRPARRAAAAERAPAGEDRSAEPVAEEPAPAAAPEPVVKRGPGRPRKVPADAALPQGLKTRGRRKAAPVAEAQAH